MTKKIEKWCYGGQSRTFFMEQQKTIHAYNAKIMSSLLSLMTIVLACYLILSLLSESISKYISLYLSYFLILLMMHISYEKAAKKSILLTNCYIAGFATVIFSFVCLIGTLFGPSTAAVMFLVYMLTVPMLLIIPVHYMYGFLLTAFVIYSVTALFLKEPLYAYVDCIHGLTCLVLGFFISRRVLESRIALLAINEELDKNSRFDALTGIPNRRSLEQYLQNTYAENETITLAMLDIDDFKRYNDTYGHLKGDEAIRSVAHILRIHGLKRDCFFARYGGEEFILIDTKHSEAEVRDLLEEICEDIRSQNILHQNTRANRLTVSIGYAQKLGQESYEALLKRADDALYVAKRSGKNCIKAHSKHKKAENG